MLLYCLFVLDSSYYSAVCMCWVFLIFTVLLFWSLIPNSFDFIPLRKKYWLTHFRWPQSKYSSCSYDWSERHRSDPCGPLGLDRRGDTNSGSLDVDSLLGPSRDEAAWSSLVDPCWHASPRMRAVNVRASSDEWDWVTRPNPFNTGEL